jgi:uncharacterized membrane protein
MSEQPITPLTPEISSDEKLWALLSFLLTPIIPIVILLMEDKKNQPFIKFHTIPTLVLGLAEIVVGAILGWIPVVNCFVPLIYIINIVFGLKAFKGEYTEIPLITKICKDQGWS